MDASQFVERYRLIYRDLYRFALCMLGNVHDAEVTDMNDIDAPSGSEVEPAEAAAVREAFASLPETDRLIVSLSVFGGYTSREIGAIAKLNPATVRSRRMRALEKMERFLGGARS